MYSVICTEQHAQSSMHGVACIVCSKVHLVWFVKYSMLWYSMCIRNVSWYRRVCIVKDVQVVQCVQYVQCAQSVHVAQCSLFGMYFMCYCVRSITCKVYDVRYGMSSMYVQYSRQRIQYVQNIVCVVHSMSSIQLPS